jgi:hypothetical protein
MSVSNTAVMCQTPDTLSIRSVGATEGERFPFISIPPLASKALSFLFLSTPRQRLKERLKGPVLVLLNLPSF